MAGLRSSNPPPRLNKPDSSFTTEAQTESPPSRHAFHKGTVVDSDPATHTAQVQLELNQGTPVCSIMSRVHDPDLRGGEIYLPKPGAKVIVGYTDSNEPFILGYVRESSSSGDLGSGTPGDLMKSSAIPMADPYIGGANDPVNKLGGQDSRREGDAGDAGRGDWLLNSSDGNGLAVLEGGVNIFKAGDLSQILGFKLGDLIRIVAQNFELFTGMGELRVVTENKKSKIEFRGSTEPEDAHPTREQWNIEAGLGGDANLFYLRFIDSDTGAVKAGFTVTKDGDILIEGRTVSERQSSTATSSVKVKQAQTTTVRASDDKTVGLNYTRKASNVQMEASSGISQKAANEYSVTASDIVSTASHTSTEVISGYRVEKDGVFIPGSVPGKTINVTNGNFEVEVGNPLSGGLPLLNSSIRAATYTGDIYLTSAITGSVILSSLLPSQLGTAGPFGIILNSPQVLLGGLGTEVAPFTQPGMAACKFEALLAYVQALHQMLDAHVHPTSVGPSGPPIAPFSPVLTPLAAPIASTMVRIAL
jgi:hypothetical protein